MTDTRTYSIEFGKLGDSYPVPALTVTATDDNELCRAVTQHAIPHLRPALESAGHPEYADCFFRLGRDRAYGEFMWLSLATGQGARFCRAHITVEAGQ